MARTFYTSQGNSKNRSAAIAAHASFGGQVRLLGYEVATPGETLAAGRPVTVTLAWQAEQAMDAGYSVFLHL